MVGEAGVKLVHIPGFRPMNAYMWRGRDEHGRDNTNGRSLTLRRLRMLRNHRRFLR